MKNFGGQKMVGSRKGWLLIEVIHALIHSSLLFSAKKAARFY